MRTFIILCLLLIFSSLASKAVNYSNLGVTDDEIVKSIRGNKPLAISQVIKDIRENNDLPKVRVLNLSSNNISFNGATKVLEFANDKLTNLRSINLSCNKISEWEETELNRFFEKMLKQLLSDEKFELIDFSSNPIVTVSWSKHIKSVLGKDLYKKIKLK